MIGKLVFGILLLYLLELIFFVHQTIFVTAQQQEQQQYSFVTQWGTEGTGQGQFMGQNDVVPSSDGEHVFVPDYENHRIQKFDSNGTYFMEWGSGSESALDGEFDNPHSVDVDMSGNVYVSDKDNHRIQKFTSDGQFIAKWGSEGTGDGQFTHLHGIAVDTHSGDVYATDTENFNVQKFDNNGTFITKWGSEGTAPGQFGSLESLDVDSHGDVYVADYDNDRIQKFSDNGTFIAEWGTEGDGSGQFNNPAGVCR
jgi:tripartite motif-containing protein 71